jgi:hypothetical protein
MDGAGQAAADRGHGRMRLGAPVHQRNQGQTGPATQAGSETDASGSPARRGFLDAYFERHLKPAGIRSLGTAARRTRRCERDRSRGPLGTRAPQRSPDYFPTLLFSRQLDVTRGPRSPPRLADPYNARAWWSPPRVRLVQGHRRLRRAPHRCVVLDDELLERRGQ